MRPIAALVAAGAACAALAAAGCGVGAGEKVGEASLRITRDYGAVEVAALTEEVRESDTALRLLDRSAEITTRYSGRFVQSIDGIEGGREDGRLYDWFYSVNGVEPSVGAAEFSLGAGDRVWWDHRDWAAAMRIPANVGSFPEPFLHGYEGERHPVYVQCLAARGCKRIEAALRELGVEPAGRREPDAIRVVSGPWGRVRRDPAAALIEQGPQASGVFARFVPAGSSWRLLGLDADAHPAFAAGAGAPLVAATRRGEDPPVWVLTGTDEAGARAAQLLFNRRALLGKYAVGPQGRPVPVR